MKKFFLLLCILLFGGVMMYVVFPSQKSFVPYAGSLTVPASSGVNNLARIQALKNTIDTLETTNKQSRVDHLFALAAEQKMQSQWQEAKKSLEEALLTKYDAHILHAYAVLLFEMGAGAGAIKYIDDALKMAPDVPNFWYTKIEFTHALTRDSTILEDIYTQALKKTNNDIDMIALYASYLARIGDREKARHYWQKAIEKNPTQRAVYEEEIRNL